MALAIVPAVRGFGDHPSWEPAPWPREAEVIGEVRWASRTFE